MVKFIPRVFLSLLFFGIWIFVIFNVEYPDSLIQASLTQTLAFFIPLFLAITFTINIFIKNILSATSISLGANLLLILQGLDTLNIVSASLVLIATYLLFSYFYKSKKSSPLTSIKSGLTSHNKIPKLTRLLRGK